jgi:hypothetical protein
MHTALDVAKEKMFKLRIDEADKARLDDLAAHYSAPAATVVRMLIKEKHEELARAKSGPRTVLLWEEDSELYERVVSAYIGRVRREQGEAVGVMLPSRQMTTIDLDGEIVLRNTRGALARYRLKDNRLVRVVGGKPLDDAE